MANDRYSNNEIYQMLVAMKDSVDKGFAGVHQRQDQSNGKIMRNYDWITKNAPVVEQLQKDRENKIKRYVDVTWKVLLTVVLIVFGFIKF